MYKFTPHRVYVYINVYIWVFSQWIQKLINTFVCTDHILLFVYWNNLGDTYMLVYITCRIKGREGQEERGYGGGGWPCYFNTYFGNNTKLWNWQKYWVWAWPWNLVLVLFRQVSICMLILLIIINFNNKSVNAILWHLKNNSLKKLPSILLFNA